MLSAPLPNSYWVEPGRILAGDYPAGDTEEATAERLRRLVDSGIDCFLDLTEPGELEPYASLLAGAGSARPIVHLRQPIRDHGLPESAARMEEILDALDAALSGGRHIYLHCRAGIGRTNLVAGCWLARQERDGDVALARLNALWKGSARARSWPIVPETEAQRGFVRGFRSPQLPAGNAGAAAAPARDAGDRCRGMLLGLAAGDALGQSRRGSRPSPPGSAVELSGGGPLGLPAGAWSDKTAMALCLAESLIERGGVDAADQLRRYQAWHKDGYWSSTGRCLGASAATVRALATAQWSGNPYAGSHDPARADAEPLARIGPAIAWHRRDPRLAIEAAVQSARITHQSPLTLDAVRYFAGLIAGALAGANKVALLAPLFSPAPGLWEAVALKPRIRDVAAGSWRRRRPRVVVVGAHAAAGTLETALWAFERGRSLQECLLVAAGLGGEADTTAAIVGELAGAYYGAAVLPPGWRARLVRAAEIEALADGLFASGKAGAS